MDIDMNSAGLSGTWCLPTTKPAKPFGVAHDAGLARSCLPCANLPTKLARLNNARFQNPIAPGMTKWENRTGHRITMMRERDIPPLPVPAPLAPEFPGPLIPVRPVGSDSKLQDTWSHHSYIFTCLQRANGMPWAIQRSPLELVDLILWTLRWRDFALICKWQLASICKH